MTSSDLLRSVRGVYVLAKKPGQDASQQPGYWALKLPGLHRDDLRTAVTDLRDDRKGKDPKETLKPSALYCNLAQALGAKDYDSWPDMEKRISDFLSANSMTQPTDLIQWDSSPGLAGRLKPRQITDRLFNSGEQLPKRIFTGVGSTLFTPSGYARSSIDSLAAMDGAETHSDQDRYEYCIQRADKQLLRATYFREGVNAPEHLDLTGRMLMLNAVAEFIGCMYTLLGSNLMDPCSSSPVFRSYNMSAEESAFELKLFHLFREEIERSAEGWVDVLPMPGNDNLVFLRGQNGQFDWVVREQRDLKYSTNPLYPIFNTDELPKAFRKSKLKAHLYFGRGRWLEQLEHDAESRHYAEGGGGHNWPGYEALIERELIAAEGFIKPRPVTGAKTLDFVPHRLGKHCLMVSKLITIDEFWEFYERGNWKEQNSWKTSRLEQAKKGGFEIEEHLSPVNFLDDGHLPVSVTWLDAMAFCTDFERRTDLPVRLLTVDDWKQVAPQPTLDLSGICRSTRSVSVKRGDPIPPPDEAYDLIDWAVYGGDDVRGGNSAHRYKQGGVFKYGPNLKWTTNSSGLEFLSVTGFAEWLGDFRNGHAPTACAATGQALMGGALERDLCPIYLSMKHKGAKVGFRLCYVAQPDA